MLDFLKKLVDFRNRDLTIILLDDEEPESQSSFHVKPSQLLTLFYISLAVTAVCMVFIVIFTPLGTLMYDREDEQLRESVIEISQRVVALQDTLRARDQQLQEIQQVLQNGTDTTFQVDGSIQTAEFFRENSQVWEPEVSDQVNAYEMVSRNEIIFSEILKNSPSFPAPFPVEGTLTRRFNQETGHLGIDIASSENEPFRSFADGTVINRDWSVSYGYVLHVQHEDGIVSIFKHASGLSKEIGDIVLKGDILGTVGDTGVLSSGPHLHVEIWRNGVPQNPLMYLVN